MKESEEIKDYLELDSVRKCGNGAELHLTKEGFTVILKAHMYGDYPHLTVEFVPPESHYRDEIDV